MAKKFKDSNIRKITRSGHSLNVSLPVGILKTLGWKEKQKVVVKKKGTKVIISDWKPKRKI